MSAADLHHLELIWPSLGPTDVIVTGTFDQWSSSIHLVKGDGGFFGTVKVPWGQKIAYKYIVDGRWQCRDDRPQEEDGHGNINNYLLTPEKPAAHDPPRLFIPDTTGDGHGDVENMVTAVEFMPSPAEPATMRPGSLPLLIPQITVDPSHTPVLSEPKLDTESAGEENISAQESSSYDVAIPVDDDAPTSALPVNGDGKAHDPSADPSVQVTRTEAPFPSSAVSAKDLVVAPSSESPVPLPNESSEAAQNGLAPACPVGGPPVNSTAEPSEIAQGHSGQAAASASIDPISTPSVSPSSTVAHKKRWSLFARIKHVFDKDKEKKEKKQKNKL